MGGVLSASGTKTDADQDEALDDSFPASDPPSQSTPGGHVGEAPAPADTETGS